MEAELRANLITLAETYAAARKLELSTVAQHALGDWRFFQRLKENGTASFTVRKYDAAVKWFADRWPADATWPANVPPPAETEAAA